jgi:peptidoglycan/xylan/chitin deacetylase (PgdA/CDA1 family)
VLAGVFAALLCACTTQDFALKTERGAPVEKVVSEPAVYRSDDFVIYQLVGGETPHFLAERFLGDSKRWWVIEDENKGANFRPGQIAVIPLKEVRKGGLAPGGYQMVPILCYHRFAQNCKSSNCMPAHVFEGQMRYLKESNYRVISLGDLCEFLQYRRSLPERSVVITIDDGYRSAYDIAYPILNRFGFKATLFIYTDYVGISEGAITWDQLREMKAHGFEVGAHTVTHCDLTKIEEGEDDQAYLERIRRELMVSKQIIDEELKQDTVYLAYPYSNYNQRVLLIAEETGYELGLTVQRGGNPFFADPLTLKRDPIIEKNMETFRGRLKTFHEFALE